jgi:probable phosphoglycerate mutase
MAPGWLIFRDGCPGGETPEQVGARVDRVIGRARAAEGDAALFAHGHMLRVLAARWLGLPAGAGQHGRGQDVSTRRAEHGDCQDFRVRAMD